MVANHEKQRALVLQGGGALGAYEAGAIYGLCKEFIKKDEKEGKTERPVFDIIIGTSIGAINGSVLVSQFLKKRKEGLHVSLAWRKAAESLVDFWKYLSSPSINIDQVLNDPKTIDFKDMIIEWKKAYNNREGNIASKEAFEKYLFGKISLKFGLDKIYSEPEKIYDKRFKDKENIWMMYNNKRLRESIQNPENGASFPIKTTFDKSDPQPRLLVVSVDVENGSTVTFDSYEKPDGSRKTMYPYNEKEKRFDYELQYFEGLQIEHIMASSAVPLFYDFEIIENRKFWDGIILNNTPLKELMEEHKAYWEYKIGDDDLSKSIWMKEGGKRVPDLDAFVINVYPRRQKNIREKDYDSVRNREQNIKYSDKTTYEEWVAKLLTDYITIIEKLIEKGNEKGWRDDIEKILECNAESTLFTYLPKTEKLKYYDLMKRRFKINVERIERKDDDHNVASQITDFTERTIDDLIKKGENDALNLMEKIRFHV
jgi:NTE family protein